jgi:hypothetical protein
MSTRSGPTPQLGPVAGLSLDYCGDQGLAEDPFSPRLGTTSFRTEPLGGELPV